MPKSRHSHEYIQSVRASTYEEAKAWVQGNYHISTIYFVKGQPHLRDFVFKRSYG